MYELVTILYWQLLDVGKTTLICPPKYHKVEYRRYKG